MSGGVDGGGWVDVCACSDVPAERGWPVEVGGRRVVVFRTPSGLRAVDNACLHVGAPLDEGVVDGAGCVTCPFHGWRYDLASGEHLTLLGPRPGLGTWPVRQVGERVEVRAPESPTVQS